MAIEKDRQKRLDKIQELLNKEHQRLSSNPKASPLFIKQDNIVSELKKHGFDVGRPTVSKDLSYLGITLDKELGCYQLAEIQNFKEEKIRLSSWFDVCEVQCHGPSDYLILTTTHGHAESVSTQLKEHSALQNLIIGTICSSDCIMVFCKNANHVKEHLGEFLSPPLP